MHLKTIVVLLLCATLALAKKSSAKKAHAKKPSKKVKSLNEVYSWKVLEYGFPSEADRKYALDNGLLKENAGLPFDVEVDYNSNGERVFITIPRFSDGIPFSLGLVSDNSGANGPIVNPYPDYKSQKGDNKGCNGIVSAFRTRIDSCNRMWVIDCGVVGDAHVCPPQLHIIDLATDTITKSIKLPESVYSPSKSLLSSLEVDVRKGDNCQNVMVYITDVDNHGLVVYDYANNDAWRIDNQMLQPDPKWQEHTVAGETFTLLDGPFTVNLSPYSIGKTRRLFLHSYASDSELAIPQYLVDNKAIWQANPQPVDGIKVVSRRGVQATVEAIENIGDLYYVTDDPLTLYSVNVFRSLEPENFIVLANNQTQLQFASGMKIARSEDGTFLWIMTNSYQKSATGTLDPSETNFRVLSCDTFNLANGGPCDVEYTFYP